VRQFDAWRARRNSNHAKSPENRTKPFFIPGGLS